MTRRTSGIAVVVLLVGVLSACSAPGGGGDSSTTGGAIGLAVTETCAAASQSAIESECVSVNGETVMLPSAFERADVEHAAVADAEGQNAVDVNFSDEGAAVVHALSGEAARAGDTARLVLEVGGELKAAVRVMQALDGEHVQILLAPGDDADDVVEGIHRG